MVNIEQTLSAPSDLKAVWKTYAYWAFWVGIAFFTVYPLGNWLTSLRSDPYHLYFSTELAIPFVPEFFWIYMSLYLLFILPPLFLNVEQLVMLGKRIIAGTVISAVVFLLLPAQLGFVRIVPEGIYAQMFSNMHAIDLPHNMAPSLHIVYSAFILLAVAQSSKKTWVRSIAYGWLLLMMLSTLLVHQHHIIDIVSALAVVWFVSKKWIKREKNV